MDAMEETAEQIAALEGFATDNVDLKRLKGLLVETDAAALKALRNFANLAANNLDFEKLKELHRKWSAEFDAIAFLGRSRDELFHSRFLAWLLDPKENHGTGAYFLENFLRKTLEQGENLCANKTGFPEIDKAVWTQTRVEREWRHEIDGQSGSLDILLENRKGKFLCAIENKVDASEHSDQLGRYRKALDENYPDLIRHYVFLSPLGMPPEQEEDRRHWIPVTYTTILELVENTLKNGKTAGMRKDVRVFLRQYATTLRRNIVHKHPEKVRELARQIYLKHREVIELIYSHKPDYRGEMLKIFREEVGRRPDWKIAKSGGSYIRFLPIDWEDFPSRRTGTGWGHREELLLFEFECEDNYARLQLALSPGTDESIRQRIIDKVNNAGLNVFNRAGSAFKNSWMHPYIGEKIIEEKHLDDWDKEDGEYIRNEIIRWVECFAQNDFPKMNQAIVNCFKEHEAQQNDSSVAGRVR